MGTAISASAEADNRSSGILDLGQLTGEAGEEEQLAGALLHILNSLQLDWNSPYHHFISD